MSEYKISKEVDVASTVFDLDTKIFVKGERLSGEEMDRTTWWIARDPEGNAVAYAGARLFNGSADKPYKMAYLVRAGVLPSARGAGLQRRLIHCRVQWAQRQKAKAAITYTLHSNSPSANNLFKAGFVLYQPEVGWVGDDVLYWWKTLGASG